MMAKRPSDDIPNRHTLAMGQTGSGKTHFIKNHPWLKGAGKRVIFWDVYESHKGVHYSKTVPELARHLARAIRGGKGFKLGIGSAVDPTKENYQNFCRVVWEALDGNRETFIIIEELADVTGIGKARGAWGQLIRVGRKYGAVLIPTTQRPQDIDKTLFTQVSRIWCGLVAGYDRVYVEKHLDLERGALASIEPESYRCVYKHGSALQWGGKRKKITV